MSSINASVADARPRLEQTPGAAYDTALHMLHTGHGDPLAGTERLLRAHPDFVPGHCLRAALLVMACRDDQCEALERTLEAAQGVLHLANERERRHLAAARAWLDNDLKRSLRMYGEIVVDHPHDTLALRVAHFGDLQWSRTRDLRDRVAAVLPYWHEAMPGYAQVLGMYAFGLAEAGEHAQAERVGRRAFALDRDNAGAVHAVAHAMEMQGRAEEGIAWLERTAPDWTRSDGYAPHLWWHLALYHLDLGNTKAALGICDQRLLGGVAGGPSRLVDASALLWRLQLLGVDLAARWREMATRWALLQIAGRRPFIDAHAMLAFVASGSLGHAARLMKSLRASARRLPDLGEIIRRSALPFCEALIAYGARDYRRAAATLKQLRHLVRHCGGSQAQCDLLHLTLLDSALRSGDTPTARALVAERIDIRPRSPFNRRLLERVVAMQAGGSQPEPVFG